MLSEFKELRKQWRKAKKGSDSPVSGTTRRGNMSVRTDNHNIYNSSRYSHVNPSLYNRPASYHSGAGSLSSVMTQGERYARDDNISVYQTRPRYNDATRASWHSGATTHEISAPQYLSSSLPTQSHIHHVSHLNTQSHYSLQAQSARPLSPPHMTSNRLPLDSTLLTPVPGYQLPNLRVDEELGFPPDVYDDESHPRPSTGHASIGYGSADEY